MMNNYTIALSYACTLICRISNRYLMYRCKYQVGQHEKATNIDITPINMYEIAHFAFILVLLMRCSKEFAKASQTTQILHRQEVSPTMILLFTKDHFFCLEVPHSAVYYMIRLNVNDYEFCRFITFSCDWMEFCLSENSQNILNELLKKRKAPSEVLRHE